MTVRSQVGEKWSEEGFPTALEEVTLLMYHKTQRCESTLESDQRAMGLGLVFAAPASTAVEIIRDR